MKDLESALIAAALLLLGSEAPAQEVHFQEIEETLPFGNYACVVKIPPHQTPKYFTVDKIDIDFRKNLGRWRSSEETFIESFNSCSAKSFTQPDLQDVSGVSIFKCSSTITFMKHKKKL